MRYVPNGQRECRYCTFCHPERPKKPCSVFGQLENKDGDCSAYIDNRSDTEEGDHA